MPQPEPLSITDDQNEVIAFLRDPKSHGCDVASVDVIETHGALVFLAGDRALKLKRAVKFPYLDFSTPERRRAVCLHELEINRRTAPEIYDRVIAITREADGTLKIAGKGSPVEWAVLMNRFDQGALLSSIAKRGKFDDVLTRDLAAAVAAYHAAARQIRDADGAARIEGVVTELEEAFAKATDVLSDKSVRLFSERARAALETCRQSLNMRAARGHVRRCHGDLHLGNVVVMHGKPVLFDALEFDDALATIDTLYDLAFLIMDLDHRGLTGRANLLLNRYFYHSGSLRDFAGLAALPLFLACRAGIRAMVAVQRSQQVGADQATTLHEEAHGYFGRALGYLRTSHPRLVAVGGFSGTGKSTLAASLSPLIGPVPGAVHLRSDLERKAMFRAGETERLDGTCYTGAANRRVYQRLMRKADVALCAGRSVIVDAVLSNAAERTALERMAQNAGVKFQGLWLRAPAGELRARIAARRGDASDATREVVDAQMERGAGNVTWPVIEAGGTPEATLAAACRTLPDC